jgi:hypothetical protein
VVERAKRKSESKSGMAKPCPQDKRSEAKQSKRSEAKKKANGEAVRVYGVSGNAGIPQSIVGVGVLKNMRR